MAGIWFTQVGDPCPYRQEGFVHGSSSDRPVGAAVGAVSESEGQQVAEFGVWIFDVGEVGLDA